MLDLEALAGLEPDDIRAVCAQMSEAEADLLRCDWRGVWARPEQVLPSGEWRNWMILGGRGSGKTRPGAEAVREIGMANPGMRIAIVAPTAADARDVMIKGESGLMSVFPSHQMPTYKPSLRLLEFVNGTQVFTYSAEEPERLRGPAHAFAWCDEIAAYPNWADLWSNLQFGLRLGDNPRAVLTTTPKPLRWLKELLTDSATRVSRCRTVDNRANLPASTLAEYERVYAGTRIGRQELEGELLEEAEGALWTRAQIDRLRVREAPCQMKRIVIAIDPSVTSGPDSDECGIIACGLGEDGDGYVLADKTIRASANEWSHRAVSLYDYLDADKVIAEANNGGDLVENVLRTVRANIPYQKVTASRGKVTRAEPIAALYEQGRVHHIGAYPQLEDEQANFVPGALMKSPNRVDALVWGFSFLMLKPQLQGRFA